MGPILGANGDEPEVIVPKNGQWKMVNAQWSLGTTAD
jgi:hypothetical protein